MPTTPLLAHTSAARARASRWGGPDEVAVAVEDLRVATVLTALHRVGPLSKASRERIAVALLNDQVAAWVARQIEGAPPLTPEQRRRIGAILAGGVK